MTAPILLTLSDAAARLGLPERSLLREAERHGHLVRVGRALRIPEAELGELIAKCRCQARVPASCSESGKDARQSGASSTRGSPSVQRAQEIADRLKSRLPTTSPGKTAQPVQLHRR